MVLDCLKLKAWTQYARHELDFCILQGPLPFLQEKGGKDLSSSPGTLSQHSQVPVAWWEVQAGACWGWMHFLALSNLRWVADMPTAPTQEHSPERQQLTFSENE